MKKYIVPLDDNDIHVIEDGISRNSVVGYLDKMLDYLDCTRTFPSGVRIIQTIGLPYKHLISSYYYVLSKLDDESLKSTYQDYLDKRHQANLEFEYANPPVIYKNKKSNSSPKKDKAPRDKPKVDKQKEKIARLGKLNINMK